MPPHQGADEPPQATGGPDESAGLPHTSVLAKVAEGLSGEPLLLLGFAALLLISGTAQALGSDLMPAGWLLLATYSITTAAWLTTRRRRRGHTAAHQPGVTHATTEVLADRSEGSEVDQSGDINADTHGRYKSTINLSGAKKTRISKSGNIDINTGGSSPSREER